VRLPSALSCASGYAAMKAPMSMWRSDRVRYDRHGGLDGLDPHGSEPSASWRVTACGSAGLAPTRVRRRAGRPSSWPGLTYRWQRAVTPAGSLRASTRRSGRVRRSMALSCSGADRCINSGASRLLPISTSLEEDLSRSCYHRRRRERQVSTGRLDAVHTLSEEGSVDS
jgi:hypothetical protein